jgi:hypothetical protein
MTIQIKEEKGQPTDRVTLYDTGDWYKAIKITVNGNKIVFSDSDFKTEDLMEKYGKKILGVGGYYKSEYIADSLRPTLLRLIKQNLKK